MNNKDKNKLLHFSLRKTTLGMASVVIGATIFMTNQSHTAQAATQSQAPVAKTNTNTNNPTTNTATNTSANNNVPTSRTTPTEANIPASNTQTTSQAPTYDNKKLAFSTDVNAQGQDTSNPQIINANESNSEMTIHSTITNPSNTAQKGEIVISIPNSTNPHQFSAILDGPVTVSNLVDPSITYSIDPGNYKSLEVLQANGNFSWDKVTNVMVTGTIKSNTQADINTKLHIKNLDQIKTDLNEVMNDTASANLKNSSLRKLTFSVDKYSWDGNNQFSSLPSTNFTSYIEIPDTLHMNNLDDAINNRTKVSLNTLEQKADGTFVYTEVPKEIQDLLPALTRQDISYINIDSNSPSPILYTDGKFLISLERIFELLKDHGYSTNITPDGQNIWPSYKYGSNTINTEFQNNDGSSTSNNSEKKPIHLEVQQIFSTKPLTINNTENWNSDDNLISAQVKFTDQSTMIETNHEDLKANKKYSYQLKNENGEVVYDSTSLADGENKKLPAGNYTVVYSYMINPTHIVTATTSLVVKGSGSGTHITPDPTPEPDPDPTPQPKPEPQPTPDLDNEKNNDSNNDDLDILVPQPKPEQVSDSEESASATMSANNSSAAIKTGKALQQTQLASATKKSNLPKLNEQRSSLPQTGVKNSPWTILGLGILALTTGIALIDKKKN